MPRHFLLNTILMVLMAVVVSAAGFTIKTILKNTSQISTNIHTSNASGKTIVASSTVCGDTGNPIHSLAHLMALPTTLSLPNARHTVTVEAHFISSDRSGIAKDDEVRQGPIAANIPFEFSNETAATFRTGSDGRAILHYPEQQIDIGTDAQLQPYFGGGRGYGNNYGTEIVDHDITLVIGIWELPINTSVPDSGHYPVTIKTINRLDKTPIGNVNMDIVWSNDNVTWHDCQAVTDASGQTTITMPRSLLDITSTSDNLLGGGTLRAMDQHETTIELLGNLL